MPKALVQKTEAPKTMAEFAQLRAPEKESLKQHWLHIKVKRLWWKVSKLLWETKDPLRYMCAVAELVIRTNCSDILHRPTDTVYSAHNAETLTRGFSAMIDDMEHGREFRNNPILTLGREMEVATFLLSNTAYVSATAHMNFHAVSIWLLGRFALSDLRALPEASAAFNHKTIADHAQTWTKYLESVLQARIGSV